jgi:hypothetical protein
MKKQRRNIIIAIAVLVILAGVFAAVWLLSRDTPAEGEKALRIDVVIDGEATTFEFRTEALFLREALEEQNLIAGEDTALGLLVKTVAGRTADDSRQEWWNFTKDGEWLFTGVDETVIEDGDHFVIELMVGYDFDW